MHEQTIILLFGVGLMTVAARIRRRIVRTQQREADAVRDAA